MKANKKFLVEFEATKKLVVAAQNEQEAIEKASKRVGAFWQVANARDIFANAQVANNG